MLQNIVFKSGFQSEEQKPLYYLLPSIFVLSILLEISSQADNDAGGLGKIGKVGFLTSTHLSFIPVLLIGINTPVHQEYLQSTRYFHIAVNQVLKVPLITKALLNNERA
ncbi:hypothetical protein [Bacillus sp. AFS031507]|uniref:hypothetical protein n=1 Tax=Bacillus sp. AFS031507 TaxID=2033496 RepID=UPI000BFB6672|nr:hypothetical protein [Bacillus sp. AFS031507]PGY09146.1 hypothetical protein COE25_18995 [Bacillus sp. AFS031507]